MNILFLDDDKTRTFRFKSRIIGHEIHACETISEAKCLLVRHKFDFCSLDHDLGGMVYCDSDHNSGYEVAKFIAERENNIATIVHSFNPVGAKKMVRILRGSCHIPFGTDLYWETVKKTVSQE